MVKDKEGLGLLQSMGSQRVGQMTTANATR